MCCEDGAIKRIETIEFKKGKNVKISGAISNLIPSLDENRIINISRRFLKYCKIQYWNSPIQTLKEYNISKSIILWYHKKTGHFGS